MAGRAGRPALRLIRRYPRDRNGDRSNPVRHDGCYDGGNVLMWWRNREREGEWKAGGRERSRRVESSEGEPPAVDELLAHESVLDDLLPEL